MIFRVIGQLDVVDLPVAIGTRSEPATVCRTILTTCRISLHTFRPRMQSSLFRYSCTNTESGRKAHAGRKLLLRLCLQKSRCPSIQQAIAHWKRVYILSSSRTLNNISSKTFINLRLLYSYLISYLFNFDTYYITSFDTNIININTSR